METNLHTLLDAIKTDLSELANSIGTGASRQVRSERIQEQAKQFATSYFRDTRPVLRTALDEPILAPLDDLVQELLELSQRNSLRTRYKDVIKRIQKTLNVVEIAVVRGTRPPDAK